MMREIRLALLEADVNLQVVKDFTKARTRTCGRGRSAGKFITCTTNRKNR